MSVKVGIAGHRGYSGAELLRLLQPHTGVETILLEHRDGAPEGPRYLQKNSSRSIASAEAAVRDAGVELVFLATPPEVSMELAPRMLAAGVRVIDLSGAFRLRTPERYQRWYRETHAAPALLSEAVYGLPEFYRKDIPSARLVANPGCYPTAANLAIRPLLQQRLLDVTAGIVCDGKSGVSGAGRKPSLRTSFCEIGGNLAPYAILEHRHVPEVLMHSGMEEGDFSFTAQLIPIERGILETIYFRAASGTDAGAVRGAYSEAYKDEPFIRIHQTGSTPDLHHVAHTNFCDLAVTLDEQTGRGVVVSAIDNLGKGAAGQAIQNMNLMLGFPETQGLL